MKVTIAEAEKLTGKSIKSIYRHISQGILTCSQNAQGQKVVGHRRAGASVRHAQHACRERHRFSRESAHKKMWEPLRIYHLAFNPPAIREASEIVNLLHSRIGIP